VGEKEKTYAGAYVNPGEYAAILPAADLAALKAGSYTLVAQSALAGEAPSVVSAALVLF
jgi:hypothetical protein